MSTGIGSIMGPASMGLQVVGGLMQAKAAGKASAATAQAYRAQAAVDQNNALLAEFKAEDAIERGALAEQRLRRDARRTQGSAKAAIGASGVDMSFGTPLDLLAGIDVVTEEDAHTTRVNAMREAYAYTQEANNLRASAGLRSSRAAAESPRMATATSLLGTATQVAGSWYRYSQTQG